MERLTEDAIRTLAGRKGEGAPVVSLYLDVDGRRYVRPKDYELHLDQLLRKALERASGDPLVAAELQRISEYVKGGIDRSHTRGLAVFSCADRGLWEVVNLPVPVRNQLVVNQAPQVLQLERVLDDHERFGVLLADKQRARMFVFELGELVEKSELFEQLPRHEDDRGDFDRDHVRDHVANAAHAHLRHAADVAFRAYMDEKFDHLFIGAPEEIANELERDLHSYLKERLAGRLTIGVPSSEAEIRKAAMEIQERFERQKEEKLVHKVRDGIGSGKGAVGGLDAVLRALNEHRVDTLVVSDGFEAPGWKCPACGMLAAKGPRCAVCPSDMDKQDDIVEVAVDDALGQSCSIQVVTGNADLDVMGRIAALLRF